MSSAISVTELAHRIKDGLEAVFPYPLSVVGEISNAKLYGSGHFYFTLKDDSSALSCVMWASNVERLLAEGLALPKEGEKIIATVRVTIFPGRGSLQLTVLKIAPFGLGDALLALEALKKKLAEDGLFDPNKKRPIPAFPNKIAVIAGAKSAAMRDIEVNLKKRWPLIEIEEFPSLVQGTEASLSLRNSLAKAKNCGADTLIIGRGGGSSEDLSAFNDEALVRALAAFPYPVISAVGHEVDFSLTDFVADLRVSTPTGAAVAAVPDQQEIRQGFDLMESRLTGALASKIQSYKIQCKNLSSRPFFEHPSLLYAEKKQGLENLAKQMDLLFASRLQEKKDKILGQSLRLNALNPKSVLQRGYSLTSDEKGNIILDISTLKNGQTISTQVKNGIIKSVITGKEEHHGK